MCALSIRSRGFSFVLLGMADYTIFDDRHHTSSFLEPDRINLEEDLFWFTILIHHNWERFGGVHYGDGVRVACSIHMLLDQEADSADFQTGAKNSCHL